MAGNPNSPHWWLRPIDLKELKELRESVHDAHSKGLGLTSITMNLIKIALEELQERMEQSVTDKGPK